MCSSVAPHSQEFVIPPVKGGADNIKEPLKPLALQNCALIH